MPTGGSTPLTFKFEFDLFGTGVDAGQTTFRLRHMYGEWGSLLAGQTNSLFMDGDVFPNTIDYWGPTGMVFYRNVQIRWTPIRSDNTQLAIAIERPGNDVDAGNVRLLEGFEDADVQNDETMPDITAQWRFTGDWGHFQAAGILRKVGYEFRATPADDWNSDSETGWGVNLGTSFNVFGKDKLMLQVVYGEGIASYMNDGGMDLAPQVLSAVPLNVTAQVVPLTGVVAYYDHYWRREVVLLDRLQLHGSGQHELPGCRRLQQGRVCLRQPACHPGEEHNGRRRTAVGQAHEQRWKFRGRGALPVHRQVQLQQRPVNKPTNPTFKEHLMDTMLRTRRALFAAAMAVALATTSTAAQSAADTLSPNAIQAALDKAYAAFKDHKGGANADYIPALAKVDPKIFGIALVTPDGKVYTAGRREVRGLDPVDLQGLHDGTRHGGTGS